MQQMMNRLQQQQEAMQQMQAELVAMRAERAAPPPQPAEPPAIDTRMLGKPEHFDGQKGWKDWAVVMRSYLTAVNMNAPAWLAEAEQTDTALGNATLGTEKARFSAQLYYVLVMTCRQQALNRVVNAGSGEGLEAWRALVRHHEPSTSTRHAGMLMELLAFSFEGDMMERLEQFERDVYRYEQSSKETFTDNVRVGVMLRNVPKGPLQEHLILNADKFKTWNAIRDEVVNVTRARATAQGASAPMDLDNLSVKKLGQLSRDVTQRMESLKAGGKKGGPGAGKGQAGPCHLCGKMGHAKKDCWWNPDRKGKGKGDGKKQSGKGNDKGGKGGSPHAAPKGPCWKCGKPGHLARDCPKNKAMHALEDGSVEEQAGQLEGEMGALFLCSLCDERKAEPLESMISCGVDSCAAHSVIPEEWCVDYPLNKDEGTGRKYLTATGESVYDKGERTVVGKAGDSVRALRMRVAKVKRPLLAVYDMCKQNHKVIFDVEFDDYGNILENRSVCVHKRTGEVTEIPLNGRTWELTMDVFPYEQARGVLGKSPFARQAARP